MADGGFERIKGSDQTLPSSLVRWMDKKREAIARMVEPPDYCACGTRTITCECGDPRCPKCDPDGCPGA